MASRFKPSPRVIANKDNARRGGLATAKKHGSQFCQARSEKAGLAVKAKYGVGFYSYIASLRKSKKGGKPRSSARKSWLTDPTVNLLPIERTPA